ncbi:MAG TPA: tetratricopeptide repeat protein [Candidatus Hydrogenedentes bacterium]|nr:tetratricopeptide repeat protein [Candidatus Hydrogenedentota bacterium]
MNPAKCSLKGSAALFLLILSIFHGCPTPASAAVNIARIKPGVHLTDDVLLPDQICCMRVSVTGEASLSDMILTPPPGVYYFHAGDHVILSVFDSLHHTVPIFWDGAGKEATCFKVLTLQEHLEIELSFDPELPVFKETPPDSREQWFDVPTDSTIYAFVGGGNLYGWFTGYRHKDHGAGITGLVHTHYPWMPVFDRTNLNFEHIFSSGAENIERVFFTPRTDPMRFCIEAPNKIRVRWDKESSAWGMDCEMIYCFSGEDAIDISFSFTPEDYHASLDYLGFMWASYMHNVKERGISFFSKTPSGMKWILFAPENDAYKKNGNVVPVEGLESKSPENAEPSLLLKCTDTLTALVPFYYGTFYPDTNLPESFGTMQYVMLFQKSEGLRYAVYNWGPAKHCSAWDWQYLVKSPQAGQRYDYLMRCLITPVITEDEIDLERKVWLKSLSGDSSEEKPLFLFPDLPLYWSPASVFLGLAFMGQQIEPWAPDHALTWYRYLLQESENKQPFSMDIDRYYVRSSNNDGLIHEWETWIEYDNSDPVFWQHLAMAYNTKGNFEKADHCFSEALLRKKDDPHILLHYGINNIYIKKIEYGFNQIKEALKLEPLLESAIPTYLNQCGEWLFEQNDLITAIQFYKESARLFPEHYWYIVHLAECYEAMGDDRLAAELFVNMLLKFPESPYSAFKLDRILKDKNDIAERINIWQEIYRQHKNSFIPALYLGKALYHKQAYQEALLIVEQALEVMPDAPEALLYAGLCCLLLNNYDQGYQKIKEALKNDPVLSTEAGTELAAAGDALYKQNDFGRALQLFQLAEEFESTNLWHQVRQGECLEAQHKFSDAAALYTAVLLKAPDSPYSAFKLDRILKDKNDLKERINIWQEIYRQHKNSFIPALYLGKALYHKQAYQEALLIVEQALEVMPDAPEALLYAGLCCLLLNNYDQGYQKIKEALKNDPVLSTEAGTELAAAGDALYKQNDFGRALQLFQLAEEFESTNLWHQVRQGECLEAQHKFSDAAALYTAVLLKAPESPYSAFKLDSMLQDHEDNKVRIKSWQHIYEHTDKASLPAFYLGMSLFIDCHYDQAYALLSAADSATEENSRAVLYKGLSQVILGEVHEGTENIEAALKQDNTLSHEAGERLSVLGHHAFNEGKYKEAVRWYQQAYLYEPDALWHLYHEAKSLVKCNARSDALTIYKTILEKAPESPESAQEMDTLLIEMEEPAKRVDLWRILHEKAEKALVPILYYAAALCDTGEEEQAIELITDFFHFRDTSGFSTDTLPDNDGSNPLPEENAVLDKGKTLVIEQLLLFSHLAKRTGHNELAFFLQHKADQGRTGQGDSTLSLLEWLNQLRE